MRLYRCLSKCVSVFASSCVCLKRFLVIEENIWIHQRLKRPNIMSISLYHCMFECQLHFANKNETKKKKENQWPLPICDRLSLAQIIFRFVCLFVPFDSTRWILSNFLHNDSGWDQLIYFFKFFHFFCIFLLSFLLYLYISHFSTCA